MTMAVLRDNPDKIGIAMGIAASFLWSTTFISGRYLLRSPEMVDPLTLVFFRFFVGGLAAVGIGSLARKRLMRLPDGMRWYEIVPSAFFLFFLMSWMLFLGQMRSTATNAALMLEVSPVLIVALWRFLRRKPVPGREWLAIGAGFCGALMVLGFITRDGFVVEPGTLFGNLLMFGGAISWVYGSVLAKKVVPRGKSLAVTSWMMVAAGVMVIPLLAANCAKLKLPEDWSGYGAMVYMALFPTALAFYCWNEAVARLELGVLTMLQFLTPVFTLVLAYLILGEELTMAKITGMTLVLAALALMHGGNKTDRKARAEA